MPNEVIRRVHATDSPQVWCPGEFRKLDVRVGIDHPSSPGGEGWQVYHCETCGEDLFIDYPLDPAIPSWEEAERHRRALRAVPAPWEDRGADVPNTS